MKNQSEGLNWLPDYQEIVACQKEQESSKAGTLPPETLAKEERIYWQDYEYMIHLLPRTAKESWAAADAILDRYEYEDSAIYLEYPDKTAVDKISDLIYESVRYLEQRPEIITNGENALPNPYYLRKEQPAASSLKEMVKTVTMWNISYRRQRYYRRRKVFAME